MKKKVLEKEAYIAPRCEAIETEMEYTILAGSPAVQPGGGGGGNVSIEDPTEDDDDNNLSGAKHFNMWESTWED